MQVLQQKSKLHCHGEFTRFVHHSIIICNIASILPHVVLSLSLLGSAEGSSGYMNFGRLVVCHACIAETAGGPCLPCLHSLKAATVVSLTVLNAAVETVNTDSPASLRRLSYSFCGTTTRHSPDERGHQSSYRFVVLSQQPRQHQRRRLVLLGQCMQPQLLACP